jgi:hypothetical protein
MSKYADLEISLSRWDADCYRVELRFSRPDDETEQPPERGLARFQFDKLRMQVLKPEVYGRTLRESLFADQNLQTFFEKALAITQQAGQILRLRLLIDRSVPHLHNLRWETLRNLKDDSFLAMDENLLFSRFLHSHDWSPVRLHAKGELRALVVVANPKDLAQWGHDAAGRSLAEVDVEGEWQRAKEGLAKIQTVDQLASNPAEPGRVTLNNLMGKLREKRYDVLYLVCHGRLSPRDDDDPDSPKEPHLWLEKPDGNADVVPGKKLVQRIRDLYANLRPTLVVLASCQSAGQGQVPEPAKSADHQGALAALGPSLAQAGIPAVLAMQGDVRMDTVAKFMPVFFEQLTDHGQIDRAMAAARGMVRDCQDWWMPVLFLRLRGGQIWYVPGFADDKHEFELWEGIINSIKQGRCTPILGAGLIEPLAGSPREIARRWAEANQFPLSPHSLDDLPQVAQYLATKLGLAYPADKLLEHLKAELLNRYSDVLPSSAPHEDLEELIADLGARRREQDPADPYSVLARLPLPIYINTNPDSLLTEALRAQENKDPQVEFSRWKAGLLGLPSIYDEQKYHPSKDKPLVYHLFGYIQEPDSLVLTEDDYFDYLMWVNKTNNPIPTQVITAWSANALLFLGFQMSDWNFRALLRSILNEERRYSPKRYKSVAVQIQPVEGNLRPERAYRYLEEFFLGVNIGIYWGSADDFLKELWRRWQAAGGAG